MWEEGEGAATYAPGDLSLLLRSIMVVILYFAWFRTRRPALPCSKDNGNAPRRQVTGRFPVVRSSASVSTNHRRIRTRGHLDTSDGSVPCSCHCCVAASGAPTCKAHDPASEWEDIGWLEEQEHRTTDAKQTEVCFKLKVFAAFQYFDVAAG